MNHILKIWPENFEPLKDGTKGFEIRRNDRNFQVGDTLTLKEYFPSSDTYSGQQLVKIVTYVTNYPPGLQQGFVALGLKDVKNTSH